MLICWEACFPELTRLLALKGAGLVLYPTGNVQSDEVYDYRSTWRHLLWARAIENFLYVGCSQNVFGDEPGFSYVFSPEEKLGENLSEGILTAELDMDRIRRLRRDARVRARLDRVGEALRLVKETFPNHKAINSTIGR